MIPTGSPFYESDPGGISIWVGADCMHPSLRELCSPSSSMWHRRLPALSPSSLPCPSTHMQNYDPSTLDSLGPITLWEFSDDEQQCRFAWRHACTVKYKVESWISLFDFNWRVQSMSP